MLTALPTLPVQLKSEPAPASAPRPSAAIAGEPSFASLIRRQAEQRLDALRLSDQQALAARVSAAAATSMQRPIVDHLASRPPMPGPAPAQPAPPKASPPAAAAPAGNAVHSAEPSTAPTRPAQASAAPARAKPPGSASRPDPARSPTAQSGTADSPAVSRAARERKPGAASGAETSAEGAATGAATLPPPPVDIGLSGLAGVAANAPAQDPGTAPPPWLGLPPDLAALPAAQAAAGPGAPAGPVEVLAGGAGIAAARSLGERVRATPDAGLAAESKHPASTPPPVQGLADDLTSAIDDPASPAASQARIGRPRGLDVEPEGQRRDDLQTATRVPAGQFDPRSDPATDQPEAHRARGPNQPDAPPPGRRDDPAAAALSGAWRPGSAPADDEPNATVSVDTPATNRRAGPGADRAGPAPRQTAPPFGLAAARPASAGPAGVEGPAASAVPTALARAAGTSAQGFDSALQAVLAQGAAPAGAVAGAARSAETPLALKIEAPVDSPLFAPALGSQLSLLARDGVRSALLQLHPAEMGPISVEIALDGNAARIDFQALRADTRSLIEASLPALAGALQDAGLTLAGGGVFEQAPGRQPQAQAQAEQGPGAKQPGQPGQADSGPGGQQDAPQPARRTAPRGLVDLVA